MNAMDTNTNTTLQTSTSNPIDAADSAAAAASSAQLAADTALTTRFSAAFKRREAVIAAVPLDALLPINIDVPAAMTTVLAAIDGIRARRTEILAKLPGFDASRFDDLEDDLLALGEAHLAWFTATKPVASLPALNADALGRRDKLYVHASSLVTAGLLDQTAIDEVRAAGGYRGLAIELLGLCRVFRANWSKFAGNTPVKLPELAEAQDVADRLLRAVTDRQVSQKLVAAAALTRQQAFTVFATSYDEVRRAMIYLRWHEGDVDSIVPSIYAGRGGRKAAPSSETDAQASSAPSAAAPASPEPAKLHAEPLDAHPPQAAALDIIPAMPNAEPFLPGATA